MRQRSLLRRFQKLYGCLRLLRFGIAGLDPRIQLLAQFGAAIVLVAEHPFGWFGPADQAFCDQAVVRFTRDQGSLSICECVYFRVVPSARAQAARF